MAKKNDDEPIQDSLPIGFEPEYESLEQHRAAISDCRRCPLWETRTKFVYGVGNPDAEIMFVGEAPGAEEDRRGEPFVGRAGQLLDKILAAMGLSRDQVYITNILKSRPPNNRDPQPAEMEACFPYLIEQIRLIKPKIICALGRIAAQAMLKTSTPLGKLRGQWHSYEDIPFIVTYHPAALLRFQEYKKGTWQDMQMLMARYEKLKNK
jgi:DNA polymerase